MPSLVVEDDDDDDAVGALEFGKGGGEKLSFVLDHLRCKLKGDHDDVDFVRDLLLSSSLQSLLKIHQKVTAVATGGPKTPPAHHDLGKVVRELQEDLYERVHDVDCRQLAEILSRPHFRSLSMAHDRVARKEYLPTLPDLPLQVDEDDVTVKIVRLVKGAEPLGATIKADETTGAIVIARVIHGGAADRSGLLQSGDELHEVNGITVRGKSPDEVVQLLSSSDGTITFKIVPADSQPAMMREGCRYYRANFVFSPEDDPSIPCPQAGLAFNIGDVLRVVDQSDPYWWQACKELGTYHQAGLIPSQAFQLKRRLATAGLIEDIDIQDLSKPLPIALTANGGGTITANGGGTITANGGVGTPNGGCNGHNVTGSSNGSPGGGSGQFTLGDVITCGSPLCSPNRMQFRRKGKHKSPKSNNNNNKEKTDATLVATTTTAANGSPYDPDWLPYEEVVLLKPRPGRFRPIVLVGAPGVGRNELRRRLIAQNPERYVAPVPSTSRPKKPGELDGEEYHFVSREHMEEGIRLHRFIEYGEYKGHLYGTSLDSVKAIIGQGKVCVLSPHAHALKLLRCAEIQPYVVHVQAPCMDRLVETRATAKIPVATPDGHTYYRRFTMDELNEMLSACRRIEDQFGHLIDLRCVNEVLVDCFDQLYAIVTRLEREPSWIPVVWINR